MKERKKRGQKKSEKRTGERKRKKLKVKLVLKERKKKKHKYIYLSRQTFFPALESFFF